MTDFLSRTVKVSNGTGPTVALTFPYLDEAHVFYYTQAGDDAPVPYTGTVSYVSSSLANLSPFPAAGVSIIAQRITPRADLLDRFASPSTLRSTELNFICTQLLYLIQEGLDNGLDLSQFDIASLLAGLRFTYDYSASVVGSLAFEEDEIAFHHALTAQATLPAGMTGSQWKTLTGGAPGSDDHIISLRRNGVQFGTATCAQSQLAWVFSVPADVTFAIGDVFEGRTTQNGGCSNLAASTRFLRIPS